MITAVSLLNEPQRKRPWIVRWYDPPDENGKQRRRGRSFRYSREARAFLIEKQHEVEAGLPPELVATTTGGACTPTLEVTGVTADKSGTDAEMCWTQPMDPCVDAYSILGATSPEAAVNFSTVVPDTGLVSCHTFNPTETYFIITGKGAGGTGPWGHFGM